MRLFFKREEAASAFLATMLGQFPKFQKDFFKGVGWDQIEALTDTKWTVDVEVDGMDILLKSEGRNGPAVIIIENKVRAASARAGQLREYYEGVLEREKPAWIGVVYVTPGPEMGKNELKGVEEAIKKRGRGDRVAPLGWTDVQGLALRTLEQQPGAWPEEFLRNGLEEIMNTIKEARTAKWPPEGDREIVRDLATRVRKNLSQRFPNIQVSAPWPNKDGYLLWTFKTNVTMWLFLKFTPKEEKPFEPKGWRVGNKYRLTVVGMVKLAVPGFGTLLQRENGWLVAEKEDTNTPEGLVQAATGVGECLLKTVETFC